MKVTNNLNLPEGFVKAVDINRHCKEGTISATTLLHGIKSTILTDRHWDEMEVDVSDNIWAIWGTAVHALMEKEGENEVTEELLSYPVSNIKVTGRLDNYDMKKKIISDYKTASVWKIKFEDFDDWKKQGLIYAWLLKKNGFETKKCRFIALLKDHSQTEAVRDSSYPQSPVYIYEFDVTEKDIEEIEIFIKGRVKEYEDNISLSDDDIKACTPDERWEVPGKFAVMKKGVKKAVKLFDDKKEAEKYAGDYDYYVEERKPEYKKCKNYCSCNKFCNFYKENVNENNNNK